MKIIKEFLLAFYDDHGCFDEKHFDVWDINSLKWSLECLAEEFDAGNGDYVRLFVLFEDGARGEYIFDMEG